MPNWTLNEISTTNPKLLFRFINENGDFDFNYFIPMPKELNIEVPFTIDDTVAYYITERLTIPYDKTNLSELITNRFSDNWAKSVTETLTEEIAQEPLYYTKETLDRMYNIGKQYISNLKTYGFYDWYGWRCKYWNTKWNACNTLYDKNSPCEIYFRTPWDAPKPIFQKMCEMFPDEDILFHCEYEFGCIEEYINNHGCLLLTERYDLDDEFEGTDEKDNENDENEEQFEINIIFELKQ